MSNSFPSVPGDFELESIAYTLENIPFTSSAYVGYTYTGGSSSAISNGIQPQIGPVTFTFDTPGSFGTFDQAAAEAAIAEMFTGCLQLVSVASGQPLATAQAAVTVQRVWTWTDGTPSNTAVVWDTMTYPPAA